MDKLKECKWCGAIQYKDAIKCRMCGSPLVNENKPTEEQLKYIRELRDDIAAYENETTYEPVKLDDIFGGAPKGDFAWEPEEAGDWHVYPCETWDDGDTWVKMAYADTIKRENGKRIVYIETVDDEGNWEMYESWEEGEDFTEIGISLARRLDDYFISWAKYYLWCAENAEQIASQGHDPVYDLYMMRDNLPYFFIEAAKDKLDFLFNTVKMLEGFDESE